jgi:hypothetical protein
VKIIDTVGQLTVNVPNSVPICTFIYFRTNRGELSRNFLRVSRRIL